MALGQAGEALDAALATDCIQVSLAGGQVTARRPVYAGKATAEVEFTDDSLKVITVRPRTAKSPEPDATRSAEVAPVAVELLEQKTTLKEIIASDNARPDVTEASIVVTGGRSLGSAENFSIIEAFADSIGAAVGSSRAAVDAGYRPYRDQVGQTGKVVSPQVYIACGVSGAIQHLAGMRTSKHIIAINTDPDAPIFQLADYGIVGDLFEVVPALVAALNAEGGGSSGAGNPRGRRPDRRWWSSGPLCSSAPGTAAEVSRWQPTGHYRVGEVSG